MPKASGGDHEGVSALGCVGFFPRGMCVHTRVRVRTCMHICAYVCIFFLYRNSDFLFLCLLLSPPLACYLHESRAMDVLATSVSVVLNTGVGT